MTTSDKTEDVLKKSSSLKNQVKAVIICNLLSLNAGMGVGWVSPAIPQILSDKKPFGDVTLEESAWLAGIFPIGALISAPIVALVSEKFGRRFSIVLWTFPFAINSIIILFAPNINYLIVGRFIMGFGMGGSFGNLSSYISEVVEPRVRGTLSSLFAVAYTMGITSSYITGGFINYTTNAYLILAISIVGVTLCFFVPETPAFLIDKGQDEKAAKALSWLRSLDVDHDEIKSELVRLKIATKKKPKSSLKAMKLLVFDKALRKGFLVCMILFITQSFTGMFAVHGYSVTIFMEGGAAQLSPEGAATLYGCIQILGTISVTKFVEKWGRKVLLIISHFGVGICMLSLGTFFYLKTIDVDVSSFRWIPVVSLCFCIYIYSVGASGIPFIYLSDVLGNEVRSFATMLITQMIFIFAFLLLRFFAPVAAAFGMHTLFFVFACGSIVGGVYVTIFVPETKGKTSKEIMEMMKR